MRTLPWIIQVAHCNYKGPCKKEAGGSESVLSTEAKIGGLSFASGGRGCKPRWPLEAGKGKETSSLL